MAEATVVEYVECHVPNMEVVVLDVTDGETYDSRKFGTIKAAVATANDDVDGELNVTYSGRTATLNGASFSDTQVTLVLYGQLGN